jgi:hypothetical protein
MRKGRENESNTVKGARCLNLKSETSLVRYDINLAFEYHILYYYLALLPAGSLDKIEQSFSHKLTDYVIQGVRNVSSYF